MIIALNKYWERFYTTKGNKVNRFTIIIASLLFLWTGTSHAVIINDFTGPYSADNWGITYERGGHISVDHSDPSSLIFKITGSTPKIEGYGVPGGGSGELTYEAVAKGNGIVSFDWSLSSFFLVSPAPYFQADFLGPGGPSSPNLIAGDVDILGRSGHSGHADFSVTTGQRFGFRINSAIYGLNDISRFSITGFSAPVTEPNVLLLFGLGLIGLVMQRQKA